MKSLLLVLAAACVATGIQAQPADPFNSVRFLTGEWVGEGAGSPGESAGACSFAMDLQGKVMVRKSFSQSATSSTTTRHEDLMVLYLDQGTKSLKAIYFDNEGHVIHYTVESGADSVRFLNEQYRLTYRKTGEDKLALDFEIAAAGKPFANYLHATLRKK